ncbi:MAG TPA: sigma-70 family RNA polymerase sigma factor [Pseudonocardiaceae bacterium]|jgi:RNA polymerase sigma-70 factor (ECF subfamily)|nr:sigma-70 family RNA polymerase sigma factor [Pseudonocardiaceae bacterium]
MWGSRVEEERLLRALYASHARPLLAYVERMVGGDRQRAEDIVQETLLRAWQHAADLTVEGARPWLFTVARRLVIDADRGRRARPVDSTPDVVADDSLSDQLDAALDAYLLADALGSLSPAHREVLVEGFYGGRTTREIAERLKIPNGTVRSRMFYALRALRLALAERGVQSP